MRTLLLSCLAIASGFAASNAHAQTYTFKTIKSPNMGSTFFEAINAKGDIIQNVQASGSSTCSIRHGVTLTTIADPNSTNTYCYGISDNGIVAGYYLINSGNAAVGFTYHNGVYTDYAAPQASVAQGGTQLNTISVGGILAGSYADANGFNHAFTVTKGVQQEITVSGANYLIPTGVSDNSQVALESFDASGNFLGDYLIDHGKTTTIAYPGATQTTVHTINDMGQLVGRYSDSQGLNHGYIYTIATGAYTTVDSKQAGGTSLYGINNAGVVVGSGKMSLTTSIMLGLVGKPN